jgi:hypothetical protein
MQDFEKILEIYAEGGALYAFRKKIGLNKDNSISTAFVWTTSEIGLDINEGGNSSNSDLFIDESFLNFFKQLNNQYFVIKLHAAFVHEDYKKPLVKYFRHLLKSNKLHLSDFDNLDSWLISLGITESILIDEYIYDKEEFVQNIKTFIKQNITIKEQWGWNRIDSNHSSYKSESDYKRFLLSENLINSDGYFNDLNKPGIYVFYNAERCIYIGKAKKILFRLLDHYKSSKNHLNPKRPSNGRNQREIFNKYLNEELTIYYINIDDEFECRVGEHLRSTIEGMLQLEYNPEMN